MASSPVPDHLIHLVCGSTGAGKTRYALALSGRIGGVYFSIDQWMAALFWMDSPQPIDASWSIERVERCRAQIWTVARQVASCGVPAVLDLGFTTRESRARFMGLARADSLSAQLHLVDASKDERWRRVQHRNEEAGETRQLGFAITREMFDFVEGLWEPPTEDEMRDCDGVRAPA